MASLKVSSQFVGVDVTAHREECNIGKQCHSTLSKSTRPFLSSTVVKSKRSFRIRYFVELVIKSVQQRAIRVGFHGSFEALHKLHTQLEKLWWHVYAPSLHSCNKATEPMPSFPESSKSLVSRLEARKNNEQDRMNTRAEALFGYYTALFNTAEEREFFLEFFRERAEDSASIRKDESSRDNKWQCSRSTRLRLRNSSSTTVTSAISEECNGINGTASDKGESDKKSGISSRLFSLVNLTKEKDVVEFTVPTMVYTR
ncbi:hypothetical protein ABG067_000017 [Albugo candida]